MVLNKFIDTGQSLSENEIRAIKKSWRILAQIDPAIIGDVFYRKLFLSYPRYKHMFPLDMKAQSLKLVHMLNQIIMRVENLESMNQILKELGSRHIGYGVQMSDYEAVGKSLIWTLAQTLGSDWNEELESSWSLLYAHVSQKMTQN
jgi:hemoglobin-like flavoprotein